MVRLVVWWLLWRVGIAVRWHGRGGHVWWGWRVRALCPLPHTVPLWPRRHLLLRVVALHGLLWPSVALPDSTCESDRHLAGLWILKAESVPHLWVLRVRHLLWVRLWLAAWHIWPLAIATGLLMWRLTPSMPSSRSWGPLRATHAWRPRPRSKSPASYKYIQRYISHT